MLKLKLKLIRSGIEDEEIKTEYEKLKKRKKSAVIIDNITTWFFILIFLVVFAFSAVSNLSTKVRFKNIPSMYVVQSASMATKNEKNTYLFDNKLNNQFDTFDLVLTYAVPPEKDLKLYDIVVYEVDGVLLIHRIVGIEGPNDKHPNERYFLCQGDAVERPDRFPVKYNQIKAIYRDQRVPFVGSFVSFMQSPAGWLCLLLVAGAAIFTPIIERKLKKEKDLRMAQYTAVQAQSAVEADNSFVLLIDRQNRKTFDERIENLSDEGKARYNVIMEKIAQVEKVREIRGKYSRTYKSGNVSIAKLTVRGKTLNTYLPLSTASYQDSKYVFTDVSDANKYKNYPMRIKISSDRQAKWTCELIEVVAKNNGLNLVEPTSEVAIALLSPFDKLKNQERKTFDQRVESMSAQGKARYNTIIEKLATIEKIREIKGKYSRTYKAGNIAVVRLAVRGKTLNTYFGLNCVDFENTKYIYTDVSGVEKYKNYSMRLKISSDRQAKWACELIDVIIKNNSLTVIEPVVQAETLENPFEKLKKKKRKTFESRIRAFKGASKAWFNKIVNKLSQIEKVREIKGKYSRTYKSGNVAVARLTVRGKTLNLYLGLNCVDFINTKYKFTDVSGVEKYKNYSMRIKITSDRQAKWACELIDVIVKNNGLNFIGVAYEK